MAIAYDAATGASVTNPGTTHTFAHTCTGSDRILFVAAFIITNNITGVTYNGTPMTAVGSRQAGAGSEYIQWYYLVAPATGTNNVVITANVSSILIGAAVSYTGASQTGQPDANIANGSTVEATTTTTLTTVADNCWAALMVRGNSNGITSAGSGTTQRGGAANGLLQMYDGDGPKTPAGSYSLQTTQSSQNTMAQMVSFSPAAAAASGPANLKSLNTNLTANIKSVNTNLIANVKSLNTNT